MRISDHIKENCNIVILTGAGISAESGIKTFRASDGLWENHRVEDVATPEAYLRDPVLVQNFYNERRRGLLSPEIIPNAGHKALAELEAKWPDHNGGSVLVITQNIDNLHERAGSKNLIHMHGELLKMFCNMCTAHGQNEFAEKYDIKDDLDIAAICPSCGEAGPLRPDIVWFGEIPYKMDQCANALRDCDLFISIGTSGNVYPAAGFVQEARYAGALTMEINLEPSINASAFDHGIYGEAGEKLPEFVKTLLSS
ncbi:MAG: Sir2 family NAD+-dependent deacetylase [Alphaproteobacteria bacterium]